jgi:hypothetical protein
VFSFACRKARPRSRYHPIVSEAFRKTFECVRHSYGFFSRLEAYGTEEEMLSDFIIQILHRELLEDTINGVPPGPSKSDIVKKIKLLAARTVTNSASIAWKKSVSSVLPLVMKMTLSSQAITFDDELNGRFRSILDIEDRVRIRLTAAVSTIVDPVLIDVATTFCAPLLSSIVGPCSLAFSEALTSFDCEMQQFIVDCGTFISDEEKWLRELDSVHRRVSHLSGPFKKSRVILWDMYTTNCSSLTSTSDNGLDPYDLYCELCDSIRKLVHNAVHHFGVLVLKQNDAVSSSCNSLSILSEVRSMMSIGTFHFCSLIVH